MTALAFPPLIPLVHRDVGLDEKAIGFVTGTTPLMLGAFAIPGALLVARAGARRAVIWCLLLVAGAGALRGVGPSAPTLVLGTLVMAAGIALVQPAYPTLVAEWFHGRVALATAVYSNGLLMGELIATFSLPLAMLLAGSWELSLAAWSVPVAAAAVLIAVTSRETPHPGGRPPGHWLPDYRDPQTWVLGIIFGGASALYWVGNAFIPDYLARSGRAASIVLALGLLNGAQIPASILLGVFARQVTGRRWPFVLAGGLAAVGTAGFLVLPGPWAAAGAGLMGFTGGGVLVLALALPPMIAQPGRVASLAAGMFTITYTCSFLAPLAGGAAWDATGNPLLAWIPAFIAAAAMTLMALRLRLPDHVR